MDYGAGEYVTLHAEGSSVLFSGFRAYATRPAEQSHTVGNSSESTYNLREDPGKSALFKQTSPTASV